MVELSFEGIGTRSILCWSTLAEGEVVKMQIEICDLLYTFSVFRLLSALFHFEDSDSWWKVGFPASHCCRRSLLEHVALKGAYRYTHSFFHLISDIVDVILQ